MNININKKKKENSHRGRQGVVGESREGDDLVSEQGMGKGR